MNYILYYSRYESFGEIDYERKHIPNIKDLKDKLLQLAIDGNIKLERIIIIDKNINRVTGLNNIENLIFKEIKIKEQTDKELCEKIHWHYLHVAYALGSLIFMKLITKNNNIYHISKEFMNITSTTKKSD